LLSHCNDPATTGGLLPGPEVVEGERIVRAIQEALELPGTKARPASITYAVGEGSRPAVLVEDIAELAARELGDPKAIEPPSDAPHEVAIDRVELARFHLFEILINNADWSVFDLVPLSKRMRKQKTSALHNVVLLLPRSRAAIPMAIDFDLSGIVRDPIDPEASEARLLDDPSPPWLARWMKIELDDFEALHPSAKEAMQRTASRLDAARRAVEALEVSPETKLRAKAHFDAFEEALSDRARAPR
jgi:hypothetical protein